MDSSIFAGFLTVVIGLIISAIPLFIAIKLLGGEAHLMKVILVNALAGIASALVILFLVPTSTLNPFLITILPYLPYLALILIYSIFFRLGIMKAIIALILQTAILYVLNILSNSWLGLTIF